MKRHAALVPLSRQHHDGLALGVFIQRDLRGGASAEVLEGLRRKALDTWELELSGHFAVEENVLFPAVRGAIPQPAVVDRLLREHEEIRAEISLLRHSGPNGLEVCLRSLRECLVSHIRYEEGVLFEAIQDSLPEPELVDLGRRIDASLPKLCARLGSAEVPSGRRS